ncbi:cytochrome c [Jannaschia sp. S6380]|uniref:c-type cytochrome n=1 Tax=Jannaschia sp. S6380 TaxID=2926408 RepID=UPI001FF3C38B|nr:cytochrome c [Jannaschia sp. S6380]MCK0166678.1 cytochrome c [Jannaschia sp. S6380]
MIRGTAILVAGFVLVAAAGAYFWTADASGSGPGAMPEDVDLSAGEALYIENCAACHGANLEGQDDWQSPGEDGRLPAPPHDETGHTWHHGDQVLFEYTKLGGRKLMAAQGMEFDSGMPGFGDQLSDQEIWNILGYIQSTWPERVQEMQATRTEGETRKRED